MSSYPEKITQEHLNKLKDVSDAMIEKYIQDTKKDIEWLSLEVKGLELYTKDNQGSLKAEISTYFASGKRLKIEDMEEFIPYLQRILAARKE